MCKKSSQTKIPLVPNFSSPLFSICACLLSVANGWMAQPASSKQKCYSFYWKFSIKLVLNQTFLQMTVDAFLGLRRPFLGGLHHCRRHCPYSHLHLRRLCQLTAPFEFPSNHVREGWPLDISAVITSFRNEEKRKVIIEIQEFKNGLRQLMLIVYSCLLRNIKRKNENWYG